MLLPLEAGLQLGPFQLESRLAIGGMAEVWIARELDAPDRMVALKFLKQGLDDDQTLRTMFLDESRLARALRQPNIVRVFGGFEIDGRLFQAMELVDGKDLRRVLVEASKRGQRMPVVHATRIARDVARALGYAHSKRDEQGVPLDIVHRDVSPQNVMILDRGQVKVLDFGVARSKDRVTKTKTGVIKGKIPYMSPEQALAQPVSPQTDVFALGAVLWEMLAMRRLFVGNNEVELLNAVCHAEVPSTRAHNPEVPAALDDLVASMLEREPKHRLHSMREVEDGLTRVLFGPLADADASGPALASWVQPLIRERRRTAVLPLAQAIPPAETDRDSDPRLALTPPDQTWEESARDPNDGGGEGDPTLPLEAVDGAEMSDRALVLEEPSAPWLRPSEEEAEEATRRDPGFEAGSALDTDPATHPED